LIAILWTLKRYEAEKKKGSAANHQDLVLALKDAEPKYQKRPQKLLAEAQVADVNKLTDLDSDDDSRQ
jgi:hypothetical protein